MDPSNHTLCWFDRGLDDADKAICLQAGASNQGAIDIRFGDDELARIDEIAPPGSYVSDYWEINVYRRLRPT